MRAAMLALALLPALAWAAAPLDLDSVAGVYKHRFANGLVDGTAYTSEDILEVVKVSASKAYVRTELQFYNGHQCSLAAMMRVEGDALAYREPANACELKLRFPGGKAIFSDKDDHCREQYCGARGSFDGSSFDAKSRRPIRYLKRLLASSEYAQAMKAAKP